MGEQEEKKCIYYGDYHINKLKEAYKQGAIEALRKFKDNTIKLSLDDDDWFSASSVDEAIDQLEKGEQRR